jgi:hypothetical protein
MPVCRPKPSGRTKWGLLAASAGVLLVGLVLAAWLYAGNGVRSHIDKAASRTTHSVEKMVGSAVSSGREFLDKTGLIRDVTGHKTRAVFERYNVSPGDLRESAQRLDAYDAS